MRRFLVVWALSLVVPGAAAAHVTIAPPFVEGGVATEISFATPNERPPHATVGLAVTAPPGISIVSASAPKGWVVTIAGATVSWSGGRLQGRSATPFRLRILARARAGTVTFTSVQTYDDDAVVRWQADLSVLPASGAATPAEHPWGAIGAGAVGLIVIAGGLAGAHLRRRPLQEK